jgi:ATP-dependent helicase/nuclease subunit A
MEIARDEVRVMTVHGAKGLEAPIVILADTTTNPAGPYHPRLLKMTANAPEAAVRMVWAGPKETDVAPVAAARARALRAAEDEYRRLLYVAMTRAADRLIVCGATGQRQRPEGCWYDLIRGALEPIAVAQPCDADEQAILRLQTGDATQMVMDLRPSETVAVVAPDWLARDARAEPGPIIITPSDTAEAPRRSPAAIAAGDGRQRALARGTLVHRLMQSLPDIAAEHRGAAASRYLDRAGSDFSAEERAAIAASVLALMEDSRFAALATPGSRAEVPIVGRLDREAGLPILVSGQIDRLAVTADAVLIADYKTDQPAPRQLKDVPESYLVQLALYRAVLAKLYPGRAVRALLVWTDVPDFMEIAASALDAAVDRVTAR